MSNVREAVPFFGVTDMEASLRFYVGGLGFVMTHDWSPQGRIRWCWLKKDDASIMLQQYWKDGGPGGVPAGTLGLGMSICFICQDAIALYHAFTANGVTAERPYVGNGLWVTSVTDPDGYSLDFESPTDVAEETVYEDPS